MLPLLQSLTIVGMIGATYFVYQTFGPRQLSFSFTKREKREWDQLVRGRLGSWLTVNSIFATITSFATVYVGGLFSRFLRFGVEASSPTTSHASLFRGGTLRNGLRPAIRPERVFLLFFWVERMRAS